MYTEGCMDFDIFFTFNLMVFTNYTCDYTKCTEYSRLVFFFFFGFTIFWNFTQSVKLIIAIYIIAM